MRNIKCNLERHEMLRLIIILFFLTGCSKYSESQITVSSAVDNGIVLYSYGETNGKLDWLVFSSANNGMTLSSRAVLTSSNNGNSAELKWGCEIIKLKQGIKTIYDTTKGKSFLFKEGLTIQMIKDEINKNGLKYDFKNLSEP